MRTGVETALDLPGFAAARTGLTEADFTESDSEAVAAEATDGTIRATAASAEAIFFIKTPLEKAFFNFSITLITMIRHQCQPTWEFLRIFMHILSSHSQWAFIFGSN